MLKFHVLVVLVAISATNSLLAKKCGQSGAFCGRGINRVVCCAGFHCEIAANDSSAKCVADTSCGTTGAFCGRGTSRVDCCDGFYCDIAPDDSYANCTPN